MKKLLIISLFTVIFLGCTTNYSDSDNTFSNEIDEAGSYGTFVATGYVTLTDMPEAFCTEGVDGTCKMYKYADFHILETENQAIYEYLEINAGNSFVGEKSIGIGCVENNVIYYENASDSLGMKKFTLSEDLSQTILDSTKDQPVNLRLEKLPFSSGSGAPTCYSHFTYIELAE